VMSTEAQALATTLLSPFEMKTVPVGLENCRDSPLKPVQEERKVRLKNYQYSNASFNVITFKYDHNRRLITYTEFPFPLNIHKYLCTEEPPCLDQCICIKSLFNVFWMSPCQATTLNAP
jgi:hypothetical protein